MIRRMSTFYYFGFGSNLLQKRIRVQNKSATRVGVGRLPNFCLDFADSAVNKINHSPNWNGSPATIIENNGSNVFGAVWKLENMDLDELDRQEGVECGIYKPLTVKVFVNDEEIEVRTYQLVHNPESPLKPDDRPIERMPSKTYLNVMLNGAVETELPAEYQKFLKSFSHNGKMASNMDLVAQLDIKELI